MAYWDSYDNLALTLVVGMIVVLVMMFVVAVPLTGTLVRFRANYTPKGLQLDGDGGLQPHTGPVVKSYFGMFLRVKRLEGWPGLYKGLVPSLLSTFVIMAFVAMLAVTVEGRATWHAGKFGYAAPVYGAWNRLAYSLFLMVFSLPVVIITNRSITTPFKLPWLNGIYSLRILLTATERRRPWILFLTPGLLISEVLRIAYIVLFFDPIRALIIPSSFKGASVARIVLYLSMALISTAIICPLEVVSTRTSIQRNHGTSGLSAVSQEGDADAHDNAVYSAAEEDVIGLRNEDDPYIGFVDCVKRIVDEEGYVTLFRGWWLVLFPILLLPIS